LIATRGKLNFGSSLQNKEMRDYSQHALPAKSSTIVTGTPNLSEVSSGIFDVFV
jgi:hypothetical protein